MPYSDLPPGATFWRCPHCGNEFEFRASGVGNVECTQCGRSSSVDQLKTAHAASAPPPAPPTASPT